MRRSLSMYRILYVAGLLLVAGVAFLPAQQPQAQAPATSASGGAETVIRTETRVVLVDAVAVDRKNKFPRDLTQKDFKIWEDGKEQKITSFSLESAGVSPERSPKHYIVLFFDTSTLGPSALLAVRQDVFKFVDTFASPDRYMAVVAYGGTSQILQNFTPDAARLKEALAKLQNFATTTASAAAPSPAAGRFVRGARAAPAPDASSYRSMLASLRTVAGSIADIRGRKALILFSGGADAAADLSTDLASTIDACNRANVAVYAVSGHGLIGELYTPDKKKSEGTLASLEHSFVHTIQGVTAPLGEESTVFGFQRGGGLQVQGAGSSNSRNVDASNSPVNSSPSGIAANQNVLRALAEGTGGLMLGTSNNLPEELGRIAQEQDEYYLLGYTPAVESAEGTCHTLRVKVDRSGLAVRARKGYCTSKPPDPLAGKPAGKDLEARAASGAAGNIPLKMQLPWFYSGANVARVVLVMDIVPTVAELKKDQGKLHGEFDLLGVAYQTDGTVAARLSDTVKLDFENQEQADAFLKTPYRYTNQFEIAPGHYDFRMAISSGGHGFGKIDLPLVIEPWNGETLSMSGLALSHDAHAVAGQTGGLDDLLLDRARPLVSNGMEVVPSANSQFRVGEKAFFYFEVYEPPLRQRELAVRVRILDRGTGRQIDDSGLLNADRFIRPDNAVIPVAMDLPIVSAGLPAGAYRLEVSVDAVVRTADFDVN